MSMGFKTNSRGWKCRNDLIHLVCVNCGKPFNCPPEYLDQLIDPRRPFHPMCYFNGKWRAGLTEEMLKRMEENGRILRECGYVRK
jgi:hypothetical protein